MSKTLRFTVNPALSVWMKKQLQPLAQSVTIVFLDPGINATMIVQGVTEANLKKVEQIRLKINPSDPIDYEHCDYM